MAVTLLAEPAAGSDPRGRRRRWLIGGTIVWFVLLVAVAVDSAGRDRATVPDQLDIASALPDVDRATGAVSAAADGAGRVLVIGAVVMQDCDVTPVRAGADAARDVTVHVRAGEAPTTLDAIAAALPASYGARVSHSRGGTRHELSADAGEFVAVHGTVDDGGTVLTLRSSTGCRPLGAGATTPVVPAGATPAPLAVALKALQLTGQDPATIREVGCPSGGRARTVSVNGQPAPPDLGRALRAVTAGAVVIEEAADRLAYRAGDTSVVVTSESDRVAVTATTGCG